MPHRADVLLRIARAVPDPEDVGRPVRVGIDGVDGAGKTWFANELAACMRDRGSEVVRVSLDGFHRPSAERYARGRQSPEGFFLDSYDYDHFRSDVLDPFGPGGNRRYRDAIHDVATDERLDRPIREAGDRAVLLVDGIFLHRDELAEHWDYSVYLDVPLAVSFARLAHRDGSSPDPEDVRNHRYGAGQRIYHSMCRPTERASVIVNNSNLDAPTLSVTRVGQRVRSAQPSPVPGGTDSSQHRDGSSRRPR